MTNPTLSGAALDTLVALIERGPLEDGDVPSKRGRDELIRAGYATKVIVRGNDGWQAATYQGRDAYKLHFGTTLGGQADTMGEAQANRIAQNAVRRAAQ